MKYLADKTFLRAGYTASGLETLIPTLFVHRGTCSCHQQRRQISCHNHPRFFATKCRELDIPGRSSIVGYVRGLAPWCSLLFIFITPQHDTNSFNTQAIHALILVLLLVVCDEQSASMSSLPLFARTQSLGHATKNIFAQDFGGGCGSARCLLIKARMQP